MKNRRTIYDFTQRCLAIGLGVGAINCVTMDVARSGEWKIKPTATVKQSVTDNVRSVNTGQEADVITTATAGIDIVGNGRGAQLDFNYTPIH